MAYPSRNTSVYALPSLNVGVLLKEDGDPLLTEDGFEFLLENPDQNPNLTTRNTAALPTLPTRH